MHAELFSFINDDGWFRWWCWSIAISFQPANNWTHNKQKKLSFLFKQVFVTVNLRIPNKQWYNHARPPSYIHSCTILFSCQPCAFRWARIFICDWFFSQLYVFVFNEIFICNVKREWLRVVRRLHFTTRLHWCSRFYCLQKFIQELVPL